jgi:uncharacterized tellurite resistance protein B-like protein
MKNKMSEPQNPLVVLLRILATALLEDKYGINETAYNALLLLVEAADKKEAENLKKKSAKIRRRFRYEN